MRCPECTLHRPAFSSRCPHCTANTGVIFMWLSNVFAWVMLLVLAVFLMWVVFG